MSPLSGRAGWIGVPGALEARLAKSVYSVRSILRTLLQRRPEDRYPSAAVLEDHLRAGLAAHGAPYGATEALAEARRAVAGALQHKHEATPAAPVRRHMAW